VEENTQAFHEGGRRQDMNESYLLGWPRERQRPGWDHPDGWVRLVAAAKAAVI